MSPRANRVFELAEPELDAVLVVNDPSPDPAFGWITDLVHGGVFEGCMAVALPDDDPVALVPPLEEASAARGRAGVVVFEKRAEAMDALADVLGDAGRVGVDLSRLSVQQHAKLSKRFPDVEWLDAGEALRAARMVKDDDEIERIRSACDLICRLMGSVPDRLELGMTERALAAELVRDMSVESQGPSFDPIVAFGAASAEPHYRPGTTTLEPGPVLVDMGCRVDGYCSDITRTFHAGPPDKDFESIYWTVHEALEAGIDAVAPGATGADVDAAARDVIESSDHAGRFIHGTGHGLGVEVHDPGSLNPTSTVELEPGMVFTVEPGVYLPDHAGVRIEEDVLVTEGGCEVLTTASRDLTVVGL